MATFSNFHIWQVFPSVLEFLHTAPQPVIKTFQQVNRGNDNGSGVPGTNQLPGYNSHQPGGRGADNNQFISRSYPRQRQGFKPGDVKDWKCELCSQKHYIIDVLNYSLKQIQLKLNWWYKINCVWYVLVSNMGVHAGIQPYPLFVPHTRSIKSFANDLFQSGINLGYSRMQQMGWTEPP